MFKQLQKIGKAFMLPIAILPAAGLLLGIGGALSNPNTVQAYPALDNTVLQGIFGVMSAAGATIFSNLALLLSIGLCIGLAKRDKGTAALAGIVGYLVMTATITAMLDIFSPDSQPIDTGVVGALVIGAAAVWLHNRYRNIELPAFLGFFGGSRFVPIVAAFAGIIVGVFFFLAWPPIQQAMVSAGTAIAGMGPIGTFFYGFLLRLSGAVGLHHMIYPMFWFTPLGGTELVNGTSIAGAQKIFFAQLADPSHAGLFTEGTRYFAGRFATMMFGLPAACLAMWHCVPKGRRAKYTGLFASVALTSFVTGITEPIEFMFLFVAPLLYVFHAFLDGASFFVADLLNIRIGNTFSGGAIDYLLFGVLQGNERTNWLLVLPVGAIWFALYYFSFRFAIKRFKIGTPGHLDDTIASDADAAPVDGALVPAMAGAPAAAGTIQETAARVVEALGGAANLDDVDACITRLRVSVKDPAKVDKAALRKLGATDVFEVQGGVQAVYGGKAILYKNAINESLGLDD
ncbi:PTS transporter subunit EIIC [Arthrobacter oryzae]|uniref:PTS glucose transporter subunit IIB n=1 Tax=Arthrobacter oryzae TaxID=409290 RepID=A0A3N0BNS0_9MICC|nr:PTS transporter subunit EIIC [Arthrobacter oryzae]RNL50381.1 PTS glucose transporter subunit IIB [Arthrobacter oryzae]